MAQAGKLRHRIQIQSKDGTTYGTRGEQTDSWVTDATVWCEIRTLSGKEREIAQQIVPQATDQVTIRYLAGVTTEKRVVFGTRNLNIGHIDNIDQRDIDLVILCGENV